MTRQEAWIISEYAIVRRIHKCVERGGRRIAVKTLTADELSILAELDYIILRGKYLNVGWFKDKFVEGWLIKW